MSSPISFEQFKSNPVSAIAFVALVAVGYLFYELRASHEGQLIKQDYRIEQLESKIDEYEEKLDEINKKLIECLRVNTSVPLQ